MEKLIQTTIFIFLSFFLFIGCNNNNEDEILDNDIDIKKSSVYHIPHNNITNHADRNIRGSIAWYFRRYGSGKIYRLSSSKVYKINNRLTIPAGATLGELSGVNATIKANTGLRNQKMIELNNWSVIKNLEIHGNRIAAICIYANNKVHVRVEKCTIHKTTNTLTAAQSSARPHLIFFPNCTNATITSSLLRRAGCQPYLHNSNWKGSGAAIYAPRNRNLRVIWNDIAYTISAGIDFTGTVNAQIEHNIIQYSGLGVLNGGTTADGITAYHNGLGYTYLKYSIKNNRIYNYKNHGIHVSGRDVHIENNRLSSSINPLGRAIYLGDWRRFPNRTPAFDCASNCTILRNTTQMHRNRKPILVSEYKANGVWVSGNTGGSNWVQFTGARTECN